MRQSLPNWGVCAVTLNPPNEQNPHIRDPLPVARKLPGKHLLTESPNANGC